MWLRAFSILSAGLAGVLLFDMVVSAWNARDLAGLALAARLPAFLLACLVHVAAHGIATLNETLTETLRRQGALLETLARPAPSTTEVVPPSGEPPATTPVAPTRDAGEAMPAWMVERIRAAQPIARAP